MQTYQNRFSKGLKTAGLAAALYAMTAFGAVADAASNMYYPHVAASLPWQTEIAVINTSAQAVAGTLKAYNNDGQIVESKDINLAARGRKQMNVADEFTNHANIGYMVYESDSDTVQGYTKFFQEGLYRAAIPAAKEVNNSDIYVSHIASNADWWTGISLVNTTADRRDITIKFNNGKSKYITLNGGQHYAFFIRDLFNGQPQPDIESAVISGASGVIGLELFGSAGFGTQLDGIPLTGKTCATLYYPHVASNDQWWTGIVAYNSSEQKSTITITPYDKDGKALSTSNKPIKGKEKYIGVVSNLDLPDETAWFKIDSTKPLSGFELFGTNDGQQLGPYAGDCETGATEGVFAKIEKQGWTGIAFVNKDDSDANVILTAYKDDGTPVATHVLPVKKHAKVVNQAEALFSQDVSAATYIGYSSDRNVVGFQLNGSMDWTMLDGLPALGSKDYTKYVITLDNAKWKTLVTGNEDRDGNGKLDLDDMAEGMAKAVCFKPIASAPCVSPPNVATLKTALVGSMNDTLYLSFDGPNNRVEMGTAGVSEPGYFSNLPANVEKDLAKVADKY